MRTFVRQRLGDIDERVKEKIADAFSASSLCEHGDVR